MCEIYIFNDRAYLSRQMTEKYVRIYIDCIAIYGSTMANSVMCDSKLWCGREYSPFKQLKICASICVCEWKSLMKYMYKHTGAKRLHSLRSGWYKTHFIHGRSDNHFRIKSLTSSTDCFCWHLWLFRAVCLFGKEPADCKSIFETI